MEWYDNKKIVITGQKFPRLNLEVELYEQCGNFWMNVKKTDINYDVNLGKKMAKANEMYLKKVNELVKEVRRDE